MKKRILGFLTAAVMLLAGCSSQQPTDTIVFADCQWDSVKLHNAVAGFIGQQLYGLDWEEVPASTPIAFQGIGQNEIDVLMEAWTDNLANYQDEVEAGNVIELGVNFDDNIQGFYVPRYVIEGDPERGIEPMAPDLRTVEDLKDYADVFQDDEDPEKGRIYGSIPGWEIDEILYQKYLYYGLDENYIYFRPGSDSALAAAFTEAYEKGEPIVGYYWEPTWLTGQYDLVLLEDAPYEPEAFMRGETACPSVRVTTVVSRQMAEEYPEYCEFLSNYHTSSALTAEGLVYVQEAEGDYTEAAKMLLTAHDELLDEWLSEEDANTVREALGTGGSGGGTNWFLDFPFSLNLDVTAFDTAVKNFAAQFSSFFDAIKGVLTGLINGVETILNFFPWWLMILLVAFLGWKSSGKIHVGLLYAAMLFIVGMLGLWDLMYETLAIVLAAVVTSLVLGLPIGILISGSDRANQIIRPVLDTMQTMPVFVYLIPAALFFGLGKAPAVIATTIYAIVPVIRLTSHGIRQVDKEVVEAARSFGSTRFQCLWKVQIPQALPTIMTGVNQTLMMAMAMVVTCSMIGANGLGMEVLIGVNRTEIGRGLLAGIAVVIVAILMDRLTQGWFSKKKEQEAKEHGKRAKGGRR